MSPSIPLSCDSFSAFPYFWGLWQFWRLQVRHLAECVSAGTFHDLSGVMSLWREDHKGKVPFHHITSSIYYKSLFHVELDLLAGVLFVRFLYYKLFIFSLFSLYILEVNYYMQPLPKEWRIMFSLLEGDWLHKLFGILHIFYHFLPFV